MDEDAPAETAPERPLFGTGANQIGVGDHNARLVLTAIHGGAMPGADIARVTALTPQTVSVILRRLEANGLIARLKAERGRAGRPRVPMALASGGALAFGLKVGRRSADLVLMDLAGHVHGRRSLRYEYPLPDLVLDFLSEGMTGLQRGARRAGLDLARICGLGIAAPGELWNWGEAWGAPAEQLASWKGVDLAAEVERVSGLPVHMRNDATSAARAERLLGASHGFRDWAYVFVGALIGGGLVLDGRVRDGTHGNPGALGPLGVCHGGRRVPLMDRASLYLLEARVGRPLPAPSESWSGLGAHLRTWIDDTSAALAQTVLDIASVIDVQGVVIDGGFPAQVREALTARTARAVEKFDARGLMVPRIIEGSVGADARALGAALAPLGSRFLLD